MNTIKVSVRAEVIICSCLFLVIYEKVLHIYFMLYNIALMFKLMTGFSNCCGVSSWWRHYICNKRRCITHWGAISWMLQFSVSVFFIWLLPQRGEKQWYFLHAVAVSFLKNVTPDPMLLFSCPVHVGRIKNKLCYASFIPDFLWSVLTSEFICLGDWSIVFHSPVIYCCLLLYLVRCSHNHLGLQFSNSYYFPKTIE